MRGAGCTINDMWDKNLDKSVGAYTFLSLNTQTEVACMNNQIEPRAGPLLKEISRRNKH
jgi:hypothetical protein